MLHPLQSRVFDSTSIHFGFSLQTALAGLLRRQKVIMVSIFQEKLSWGKPLLEIQWNFVWCYCWTISPSFHWFLFFMGSYESMTLVSFKRLYLGPEKVLVPIIKSYLGFGLFGSTNSISSWICVCQEIHMWCHINFWRQDDKPTNLWLRSLIRVQMVYKK